jgi:hypothetical protein
MAWVGATAGATAATTAAAAELQRQHEEEENMTPYTQEELDNDWEFKIVRSAMGTFSDSNKLRQLIDEEAQAGWVLVEKFDDSRVRFKRPASARQNDYLLDPEIDPYRTAYGTGNGLAIAVGVSGLVVVLVIGIVVLAAVIGG